MEALTKTTKNSLCYQLNDPGYTIYHRASLGGLAATVRSRSWLQPYGINITVQPQCVNIMWDQALSKTEALKKIADASFRLSADNLIELPGHNIPTTQQDLKVAIHNGITQTFLQHPKSRPGDKEIKFVALAILDETQPYTFSYKPISKYAHQSAQGTGLFDDLTKFPEVASITQALVPGAFTGAKALNARGDDIFLLMYLMVGSPIFHLRPRAYKERSQYCVVIPDVINLNAFAKSLHRLTVAGLNSPFECNSLPGRVVGGAEDAALRFLLDLRLADKLEDEDKSVSGCQAIAMGKVAWDPKQINRSMSIRVKVDYDEIDVFKAAVEYLGKVKVLKTEKGEGYAVPTSDVPELIATNLAKGIHWCSNFKSLMDNQNAAKRLSFMREGFIAMKSAIKNQEDRAIIDAFHDAWRRTLGTIGERASRDHFDPERLMEVEKERVRNSILRAKNSEMLASWFLRFCAQATKGGSLKAIKNDADRICTFIFDRRNFERFQNLCLFALVSYEGKQVPPKRD